MFAAAQLLAGAARWPDILRYTNLIIYARGRYVTIESEADGLEMADPRDAPNVFPSLQTCAIYV